MITQHPKWLEACERIKPRRRWGERLPWTSTKAGYVKLWAEEQNHIERDMAKMLIESAQQLKDWHERHERIMAQ